LDGAARVFDEVVRAVTRTRKRQALGNPRTSWVGAVLVVALLVAESFCVTHPLDAAAHSNGKACAVCLSTVNLGAGAVSAPTPVQLDAASPQIVVEAGFAFVSTVPNRRYARGPPVVSFVA
jgi:hypothetical protein